VKRLKERETEGFNLMELGEFKSFFGKLEKNNQMCQIHDEFEALESDGMVDCARKGRGYTVDGKKQD
jgi:hypothetical protein